MLYLLTKTKTDGASVMRRKLVLSKIYSSPDKKESQRCLLWLLIGRCKTKLNTKRSNDDCYNDSVNVIFSLYIILINHPIQVVWRARLGKDIGRLLIDYWETTERQAPYNIWKLLQLAAAMPVALAQCDHLFRLPQELRIFLLLFCVLIIMISPSSCASRWSCCWCSACSGLNSLFLFVTCCQLWSVSVMGHHLTLDRARCWALTRGSVFMFCLFTFSEICTRDTWDIAHCLESVHSIHRREGLQNMIMVF